VEEARIATAIGALGIDWTPGETAKNTQLAGTIKPGPERKIAAGETVQVEVTAENKGAEPIRRLRAWTESDNGYLDRREFLFGLLKPGEKKSWSVQLKLPKDLTSRRDGVTVKFQDDSGQLQETVAGELSFAELPRPTFAFNYQVIDDCAGCNGDGLVQRGEEFTLLVDITNTGTGRALDTFASIKNAADSNVFIEKGRFKVGELGPGETRTARFDLTVKKAYSGTDFGLRLAVIDEPLEEFSADRLSIPVADDGAPPLALEARKGVVRLAEKAEVLASAEPGARVLARLPKGAVVNELARGAAVSRVEWEKDRFAFVRLAEVRDAKGAKAAPAREGAAFVSFRTPPEITLSVDPAVGGVVADGERFTLSGVVIDPQLLDVYVLVNDQKVFFRGHEAGDDEKLKFTTEFALKEGNNLVTVVARESADFSSRKTVVIRRRPAAVAQKLPPPAPTKQ
jgi:carboxyl-terminal processing protease